MSLIIAALLVLGAAEVSNAPPRLEAVAPPGVGSAQHSGDRKSWWRGVLKQRGQPLKANIMLHTAAEIRLLSACLDAGLSQAAAVAALAQRSEQAAWRSTATLLAMGAHDEKAWTPLADNPYTQPLSAFARSSQHSGSSIREGCQHIADTLENDAQQLATARAERAGVLIAMPLTLCFLPAFFLLGLAPVVISLGMELFGAVIPSI